MKTVLILRHGKSDWDADFNHDHERPLAKRGRRAAKRMGRFLSQAGPLPDYVLCSSAVRTRRTLERARKAGEWDAPVHVTDALYLADTEDVVDVLRTAPEEAETVLIVGHEPTCSETISALIGGGDVRFPTAAMARIDLDVDAWEDIDFDTGVLQWLVIPKAIK